MNDQVQKELQKGTMGILPFMDCLRQKSSNKKEEGLEKSIDYLNQDSIQNFALLLLKNEEKFIECSEFLSKDVEKIKSVVNSLEEKILNKQNNKASGISSSNMRFLGENSEYQFTESSYSSENHKEVQSEIPLILQQGSASMAIIIIALLLSFSFVIVGIIKFIKKKKENDPIKKQRKLEKLKFLPRIAISSEAIFSDSKNGLNGIMPKKGGKNKGGPIMLSPSHRTAHALKLEENHQSAVINENIFTNIDNSPKSLDDDSPTSSVRDTPKDVNFNIEFSMIEQHSQIKSGRDE